ncbi:hypothetical protein [uncultured Pluralibacter sp.]|uniref:hypothetical protein n=1 Tax=uncultured Pluralibacter sp. TaxID=1490864 RepID=UPI00260C2317|nr:hypothetical protein [uncultured Pluralibacter sp.]
MGAILNQLVFWSGKSANQDGWFYKSHDTIAEEVCGVTGDQVRKAINKLVEDYFPGIIEVATHKVKGTPVKHYRIDGDALIARIFPSLLDSAEEPNGNGSKAESILYTDLKTTDLKDLKTPSSENSGELSDRDKNHDFVSRHPEAVVSTPSGRRWGSQDDLDCAVWIYDRIKITNPTQREPNWTVWANDVRLMRQIDGFTHKQICQLFKRASQDSFWRTNILCPSKLRDKWDILTAKFNTGGQQHEHNTGESSATRQIREAFERWEQDDSEEFLGSDGEDIRPAVDCEEWFCT